MDDVYLSTAGPQAVVQRTHTWASRLLMEWVKTVLGKTLAEDKKQCVASTHALRKALKPAMARLGFSVTSEGELLGTDYGAGGKISRRKVLNVRIRKVKRRRVRLRWWKKAGGDSRPPAAGHEDHEADARSGTAHRCGRCLAHGETRDRRGWTQGHRPRGPRSCPSPPSITIDVMGAARGEARSY